jgi:hypothetical protein
MQSNMSQRVSVLIILGIAFVLADGICFQTGPAQEPAPPLVIDNFKDTACDDLAEKVFFLRRFLVNQATHRSWYFAEANCFSGTGQEATLTTLWTQGVVRVPFNPRNPAQPAARIMSNRAEALTALASRLGGDVEYLVVRIGVKWNNGHLTFTSIPGQFSLSAPDKASPDEKAALQGAIDVATIDTRRFELPVGFGNTLMVNVKALFSASAITLSAAPVNQSLPTDQVVQLNQTTGTGLAITNAFLNMVSARNAGESVRLGPQSESAVHLRDMKANSESGRLEVSGAVAEVPNSAAIRVTSAWTGSDLALDEVRVDVSCGQLSPDDCVKLQGKYRIAAALLTNSFKGKLLKPVNGQEFGDLDLRDGRAIRAKGTVQRLFAGPSGIGIEVTDFEGATMKRLKSILLSSCLAVTVLVCGCDKIGLGGGLFGSDKYAVYMYGNGPDVGQCWVQTTTEQPHFGNKISVEFDNKTDAVAEGCRLLRAGTCDQLKSGSSTITCP